MLGEFMGQKNLPVKAEEEGADSQRRNVQVSSCAKLCAYNLLPVKV